MNDLQLALLLIGMLAIAGVLVHGVWTLRQQTPPAFKMHSKKQFQHQATKTEAPEPESDVEDPLVALQEESMMQKQAEKENVDLFECEKHKDPTLSIDIIEQPLDMMSSSDDEVIERLDPKPKEPLEVAAPEDILVLHLKSSSKQRIPGSVLLESLLGLGLKHGNMGIFHSYQSRSGQEEVMFSLVNMAAPGIFSLETMSQQTFHGVSLFLQLPVDQSMMRFSLMLNTASQLAEDLNLAMFDDERQAWSSDKKQSYISRIKKSIPQEEVV